nr:uncharacterized protein LOC117274622 [Nicotiana tomentosiformis]
MAVFHNRVLVPWFWHRLLHRPLSQLEAGVMMLEVKVRPLEVEVRPLEEEADQLKVVREAEVRVVGPNPIFMHLQLDMRQSHLMLSSQYTRLEEPRTRKRR